jgi:nucleotide-binding universal stress UspA family protein
MYDKILVPLDGSDLAEVTLWYGARLASRLHAVLTLLYVASPDELTSPHMYECYLKYTSDRVKAEADKSAAETGGGEIAIDYKTLRGDPAEEIVDYANKAKIDLIIMSTQGKSGIRRWALGNVVNKVLRATRKQVLLIRARGAEPDVYKERLIKVLVPVDGSRESESILKFVTYMAAELNLEVTLFHMWVRERETYPASMHSLKRIEKIRKREKDYIKRLGARLKDKGLNVETVFSEVWQDEEAEEIIKLAEKGRFSMVAMATHGRSGVGRWIFGSNADKVLNEGSTPLLLVRPVKRSKARS